MLRSSEELGPGCGYGFNITDDRGKLLVLFAYDTQGAAEAAPRNPQQCALKGDLFFLHYLRCCRRAAVTGSRNLSARSASSR